MACYYTGDGKVNLLAQYISNIQSDNMYANNKANNTIVVPVNELARHKNPGTAERSFGDLFKPNSFDSTTNTGTPNLTGPFAKGRVFGSNDNDFTNNRLFGNNTATYRIEMEDATAVADDLSYATFLWIPFGLCKPDQTYSLRGVFSVGFRSQDPTPPTTWVVDVFVGGIDLLVPEVNVGSITFNTTRVGGFEDGTDIDNQNRGKQLVDLNLGSISAGAHRLTFKQGNDVIDQRFWSLNIHVDHLTIVQTSNN